MAEDLNDCSCPSLPQWGLWPQTDPDAPVAYFGQVRSRCGATMRWRCQHRHPDRPSARECAKAHLEEE